MPTTPQSPDSLRRVVRELVAEWRDAAPFGECDSWLRSPDIGFSKALASAGLIGMTWPAPYGSGMSNLARLAVTEELLRVGAPVAAHWIGDRQIGPAILRHGSEELKREILPGIAAAESFFCLGMSEPQAGSDLAAVRTSAVECPNGYRIRGRKMWTSGAHRATHAYVLARTTPIDEVERRHQGLSEFIVDMDSPGISISPIVDLAGEHHFNEVVFDDVFVPAHRVLGTVGSGWRQVMEQLSFERGGPERVLSTYPLLATLMADEGQGCEPVARGKLLARLAVLRDLCRRIAIELDAGRVPTQEAVTCKYLGNAFESDVIEHAREVIGSGTPELRARYTQALLASPAFSIRGGSAEVLLSIIAKQEAEA